METKEMTREQLIAHVDFLKGEMNKFKAEEAEYKKNEISFTGI